MGEPPSHLDSDRPAGRTDGHGPKPASQAGRLYLVATVATGICVLAAAGFAAASSSQLATALLLPLTILAAGVAVGTLLAGIVVAVVTYARTGHTDRR